MEIVAEEWRTVVGFELYEVSSLGRVRSTGWTVCRSDGTKVWKPGRVLKPGDNGNGYQQVNLRPPLRTMKVHWLVAEAFIGERPAGMEVNHRDGNKANNSHKNLEYVTKGQNLAHAIGMDLRHALPPRKGESNCKAKLTEEDVREIRRSRDAGTKIRLIAERFAVSQSTIKRILYKNGWSCVA